MTRHKKKDIFEQLLEKHTPEELAESFVFPVTLSPEERVAASAELAAARAANTTPFTEEDKRSLQLFRLRLQMDTYIRAEFYRTRNSFGYFLKEYVKILGRKRKEVAAEIDIDPTLLSQLANDKREPPRYVYFRLELHSGGIIPADYWFRVTEKHNAHNIKTDKLSRQEQQAFVRNKISVSPKKNDKSDIREDQA